MDSRYFPSAVRFFLTATQLCWILSKSGRRVCAFVSHGNSSFCCWRKVRLGWTSQSFPPIYSFAKPRASRCIVFGKMSVQFVRFDAEFTVKAIGSPSRSGCVRPSALHVKMACLNLNYPDVERRKSAETSEFISQPFWLRREVAAGQREEQEVKRASSLLLLCFVASVLSAACRAWPRRAPTRSSYSSGTIVLLVHKGGKKKLRF